MENEKKIKDEEKIENEIELPLSAIFSPIREDDKSISFDIILPDHKLAKEDQVDADEFAEENREEILQQGMGCGADIILMVVNSLKIDKNMFANIVANNGNIYKLSFEKVG